MELNKNPAYSPVDRGNALQDALSLLIKAERDAWESTCNAYDFVDRDSEQAKQEVIGIALMCEAHAGDITMDEAKKYLVAQNAKVREFIKDALLVVDLANQHWPNREGFYNFCHACALTYRQAVVEIEEIIAAS